MDNSEFRIIWGNERPELLKISDEIVDMVWPEFILHDSVGNKHWDRLYEDFPEYQFVLMEQKSQEFAASGNCVPLVWDKKPEYLPDEGWDWAISRGFSNLSGKNSPNLLCALSISVAQGFQGRGLSRRLVNIMKTMAENKNLTSLIAPVRPNHKCKYPLTPIKNYIYWNNDNGLPFDPWIRVHMQLGGKIVKICYKSMKITGSINDWQQWTGMIFPETMEYVIPGALAPVSVNVESDTGVYVEPNVWIIHSSR